MNASALKAGLLVVLAGTGLTILSGCEEEGPFEEAGEEIGDSIEDAADEVEDEF